MSVKPWRSFTMLVIAALALVATPSADAQVSSSRSRFTWDPIQVPSGPVTDSEFALFHLQRVLYDPVDPMLLGSLQRDLQFRVNGEVYRFGSEKTLRRFMSEPQLWCGLLRDPVSGRRFRPSTQSPEAYYVGGPYFFESDSTKDLFVADPHQYEVLREM